VRKGLKIKRNREKQERMTEKGWVVSEEGEEGGYGPIGTIK
jgi:hypothetical protein